LWCGSELLRSRALVRLSCSVVRCSRRVRSGVCCSGSGVRRSGSVRSDVCGSSRVCSELLRSGSRLRRLRLQSEEAQLPRLVLQGSR